MTRNVNKRKNVASEKKSRMAIAPKSFVEQIAARYGGNKTQHIIRAVNME